MRKNSKVVVTYTNPSYSHKSKTPKVVTDYFIRHHDITAGPVLIESVYRSTGDVNGVNQGWKRHPLTKRISISELRRLRADGATFIAVKCGRFVADFKIAECI